MKRERERAPPRKQPGVELRQDGRERPTENGATGVRDATAATETVADPVIERNRIEYLLYEKYGRADDYRRIHGCVGSAPLALTPSEREEYWAKANATRRRVESFEVVTKRLQAVLNDRPDPIASRRFALFAYREDNSAFDMLVGVPATSNSVTGDSELRDLASMVHVGLPAPIGDPRGVVATPQQIDALREVVVWSATRREMLRRSVFDLLSSAAMRGYGRVLSGSDTSVVYHDESGLHIMRRGEDASVEAILDEIAARTEQARAEIRDVLR